MTLETTATLKNNGTRPAARHHLVEYPLGEIAMVQQGYTFRPDYQGQAEGKWLYVKVGDLNAHGNTKYIDRTLNYVDDNVIEEMGAKPFPSGSIVFPRVGAALRNNNKRILRHASLTDDNVIVVTVRDARSCSSEYLYYWFDFQDLQRFCNDGTVPVINGKNLKRQCVPLPNIELQQEIADLLSTWDTAIQKTEQLIAAKEQHFAATSHLLLTSRKRLNGFSMKWGLRRADEIFENTSRKGHLNEPLLSVTQERGVIPRDMLEGRVTMPSGETGAFKLVEPGNFVISLRSFQGGLEHSNYRGLVSPAYTVLKEVVEIDRRFFRHYFKSADFIKRLSVAVIGIRDGKQISFQDFCSIKLPFPSVDEQRAIAALLDQAEDEINLLRDYAEALKTQKRGLMQKLLTGQWRLPITEVVPA